MLEFFNLAAQWLRVRQVVLQTEPLSYGNDIAGCMLGMRDLEREMKLVIEEMMINSLATSEVINLLCSDVHKANKKWWICLKCSSYGFTEEVAHKDGPYKIQILCPFCHGTKKADRNVGEMLALVHSEISEALEGHRKNLMDDKLPHRKMFEVELADAIIRIFDIAGGLGLDLGGAYVEKMKYNAIRKDHKIEDRMGENGKKY